jgi:HlyD family secretion protein
MLTLVAFYSWRQVESRPTAQRYITAAVDRGDITQTVSANGTLNPVVLVNVGTQVSGTIKTLHVDFNDRVTADQVLAKLDPALLAAQLQVSEANLSSAEANLRLAQANARRTEDLYKQKYAGRAELDQVRQALEAARAQVEVARAQVNKDRTNLNYTIIRSPVAGVVIAREVDVGQTVAASFQTPTLFKIAQDLRRMQIDTSVAEADIGLVKVGQTAYFTVDAYPDRRFKGQVKQVRLNPTVQANVVTYNVVVLVDNEDELLMPGMTANVHIVVRQQDDVLRIPNTALRFRLGEMGAERRGSQRSAQGQGNGPTVYRMAGEVLEPVRVRIGVTDQKHTEVVTGELKPGDLVVTADASVKKRSEPQSSFRFRFY